MPQVKLKAKESKEVARVTFTEKDFLVVKLESGKITLLHKHQAEKLIARKKATLVKDAEVVGVRSHISKVEIKKK